MTNRTCAMRSNDTTPPRLRIAAGRKTGRGPLIIEPPMTQADIDAHTESSYVRRPKTAA